MWQLRISKYVQFTTSDDQLSNYSIIQVTVQYFLVWIWPVTRQILYSRSVDDLLTLDSNGQPAVGQLPVIDEAVVEASLHDGPLVWAGGHKLALRYLH